MTDSQQVRGRHAQDRADGQAPAQDRPLSSGDDRGHEAPAGLQEPVAARHDAHGQSVASWTAVSVIMLGSLIMAVAVVITTSWLFAVGAVVVVLGAVAGKVLSAMGFGVSGRPGH
ncbi:MAG: HGxxPAAW family protein [Kineosporiaceae bacterium]